MSPLHRLLCFKLLIQFQLWISKLNPTQWQDPLNISFLMFDHTHGLRDKVHFIFSKLLCVEKEYN